MSYYHSTTTRTYRSSSVSGGDWSASSFDSWRSPGSSYRSLYSGRSGGSTINYRPRYQPWKQKPDYDSPWWKYRHYAGGVNIAYGNTLRFGGSSYRSHYSGGSGGRTINHRPRYQPGKPKPDYDSTWWKYRHYAGDEEGSTSIRDKEEGKSVITLDMLMDENRKSHNTHLYGKKSLIVRRGQEFCINVQLSVSFDKDTDRLQFLFSKGNKAQESKGTMVRIDIHTDKTSAENDNKGGWHGYIKSINGVTSSGSTVTVAIKPPHDALVGKYSVKIKLFKKEEGNVHSKRYMKDEEEMLYVLFNPWCKDDQVFMADADQRDEYVINETGRLWMGKANSYHGRPWNFGQFSRHCLEAAIYLLEINTTLTDQAHGNVTLVCRALSAMANNNDNDRGVLVGNWSGSYGGGTSPTSWNGSQAILEEYMLSKRAVKFGQCWVFSGLLTTLARTLGIPTRSVTNFESAHDHDFSLTIDNHYYTDSGSPEKKIEDSVWNFHVWNESWFQRPDLPDGYDGWQAYDATPQEASEGLMRCGPAPVKAIKEGNVYLGYDSRFIFAEVNGDRVDWVVEPSGDMYISSLDAHSVGKNISTKMVGSRDMREDLTEHYKHSEGSEEERKSVARASKYSSRVSKLDGMYAHSKSDVVISYKSAIQPNADITITLNAENKSGEDRHLKIRLTANAAYYTGIPGDEIGTEVIDLDLKPGGKNEKIWSLKAASYLNVIEEDAKVKTYLMARSKETGQVFTKSEVFNVEKPELNLQISNTKPKVGEKFEVVIKVTNPVDVALTGGIIRLEGPGIQKNMKLHLHRSVNPGEDYTEKVSLTAKYAGRRELIACFNSRQLSDVVGSSEIEVQ